MKQLLSFISAILLLTSCAKDTEVKELKTSTEKMSYAFGLNIGASIKPAASEIDYAALLQGIKDAIEGQKPLLTNDEKREAMNQFRTLMRERQAAQNKELGERNKTEGDKFLAENKSKEGVVTTESGLQYQVLTEGTGPKPQRPDRVKVHYSGTLIDGTEFDSSYKRGQPATFGVTQVISGWIEALQLMNVGSKYRLVIPSDLAYGERGSPPTIGPNATLIFEVELLEIVK